MVRCSVRLSSVCLYHFVGLAIVVKRYVVEGRRWYRWIGRVHVHHEYGRLTFGITIQSFWFVSLLSLYCKISNSLAQEHGSHNNLHMTHVKRERTVRIAYYELAASKITNRRLHTFDHICYKRYFSVLTAPCYINGVVLPSYDVRPSVCLSVTLVSAHHIR